MDAKQATRTVKRSSSRLDAIHIAGLWSLAVAQPVFDILRGSPEFFVAHDTGPGRPGRLPPRLSQEIRQAELGVQALSGVAQVLGDECRQPQAFIQLAHQKETGVGGDARPLECDLQKAIERELKRLVGTSPVRNDRSACKIIAD